jgi:dTDP-4-dehydrorhamnose 3,5-epimerase
LNLLHDARLTIEDFEHEAFSIDWMTGTHSSGSWGTGRPCRDGSRLSDEGAGRLAQARTRRDQEALMQVEPLSIEGAWVFTPQIHGDERGAFLEWYKGPVLSDAVGHRLDLLQANASVSARGVLRGIHFADVPPGQAKYVTCVKGSVLDVIVDIRVGSPTFRQWTSVLLDDRHRRAVYLSEGLGHGFCSLEDGSTVVYLCSQGYNPSGEHEIHPLDPAIGIEWPLDGVEPELSAKDAAAPTLEEAAAAGLLPTYDGSRAYRAGLA